MPAYSIRYVCDTSLQFQKDVSFESKGKKVLFLFSQRGEESTTRVRVDVEAGNYREVDVTAQGVLNLCSMLCPSQPGPHCSHDTGTSYLREKPVAKPERPSGANSGKNPRRIGLRNVPLMRCSKFLFRRKNL